MIPADPQQQETLRLATLFESLVQHDGWREFVYLARRQRDQWLRNTQTSQDRDYLSAQAVTVNLLVDMPQNVIEKKDAILAELASLAHEQNAPENVLYPEEFVRPRPQAV